MNYNEILYIYQWLILLGITWLPLTPQFLDEEWEPTYAGIRMTTSACWLFKSQGYVKNVELETCTYDIHLDKTCTHV
jgi:hypothetical protein